MSKNISREKRENLLAKIREIRTFLEGANATPAMKSYLSELESELKRQKFGLVFEEHKEEIDEILETHTPVLTEDKSLFIDNGGQMNFLIEGDNLAALTLLEKTHKGKIDIIYIDPPYNTRNKDFVYDDTFIGTDDLFRHSKWLSFMKKRLILAKSLLSESGAIFISIDDNEQSQLKLLCDDVFGEVNYVDSIVWDKKASAKGVPPKNMMVNVHEYILAFQKSEKFKFIGEKRNAELDGFKNPDNDPRGPWRMSNIKSTIKPFEESFTIVDPSTGREYTNTWAFSKESLERMIRENRILWKESLPKQKEYLLEMTNEHKAIKSSWGVFDAQSTTVFLKTLIPEMQFNNPKPISLMKYLLRVIVEKKAIVVDFFAGSGTTGHALMELNEEDGGNRKFILCTNNENNICRGVTYERIKRVIDKEDYKASLKYQKIEYIPTSEQAYYDYADELLLHIKELVELENTVNFEGNTELVILLTEDEVENFFTNGKNLDTVKTIYLGHDIALTLAQQQHLTDNNIGLNIIPEYYYKEQQI